MQNSTWSSRRSSGASRPSTGCWSTPASSPIQLRGVATDNQAQIGPALKEVDDLLSLLNSKDKELKATLNALGPYASILGNIIGTGPWFDAYAVNLAAIPTGEFLPGPRGLMPMNAFARLSPRIAIVAVAVVLLAATFLFVHQPDETKTVTAHFPRAVSVYKGTDVRVLGVNVGRVTAVIPEGNSVRVEMEYDADVRPPEGRQGRGRDADAGGGPVRPAHARSTRAGRR